MFGQFLAKLVASSNELGGQFERTQQNTSPERKLPMNILEKLKNNAYIKDKLNVIIIGATGTGKTWLSCAYGSQTCF